MKKLLISLFVVSLVLLSFFKMDQANAMEEVNKVSETEIENLTGTSLDGYNFIEYSAPVTENYDGVSQTLLGYFELLEPQPFTPIKTLPIGAEEEAYVPMDYREYTRWYVYDQGIVKSWSYLSNPYFIKSIARGMSYEKTEEVSATISGSFSSEFPSGPISAIKREFGMSASGTKKVTVKITLTGPDAGYSSRDFYYKKGRHTHSVKVVEERRSNWDGLISKKTYVGTVGMPAIKHYSIDRR